MRILYFYPGPIAAEFDKVRNREAPSERMYGLVELRAQGHQVDVADQRFQGAVGNLVRKLRKFHVNASDLGTLRSLSRYDVVVVKDEFSSLITLACKIAGTPVVYMDALFNLPRRWWKRPYYRTNIHAANGVVAYSRTQIAAWRKAFGLREDAIQFMPYAIDCSFYQPAAPAAASEPYVLSVGRDMGRDFSVLCAALKGTGLKLKLVTLPYLLRGLDCDPAMVEIRQRVPYTELFELYANARLVVVPLKSGITYPSGIRGLLESMALGAATISTRTPVLEEYAGEGEGVSYVDAENPARLRERILELADDATGRERLAQRGAALVKARFDMPLYGQRLADYLGKLT